jgi:hypothetical protein
MSSADHSCRSAVLQSKCASSSDGSRRQTKTISWIRCERLDDVTI